MERQRGLVVLNETQRRSKLLELLRVLTDPPANPARFLVFDEILVQPITGVVGSRPGTDAESATVQCPRSDVTLVDEWR